VATKIISIRVSKKDTKIQKIKAREILDSRGNPTVEVDVYTKSHMAREQVPSGASTGIHEALELRDGGKRYNGQGVLKAVKHVNTKIFRKIKGMDLRKPAMIDKTMVDLDGTDNKSKLGANAILGVSLACHRLSAYVQGKKLYSLLGGKNIMPTPHFNIINGGKHAANKISIQEFMIAPRAKSFSEQLRMGSEIYHDLKKSIINKYGSINANVGDEGGFAPNLNKTKDALDLIMKSIEDLGHGKKVNIAMDVAASEFYNSKTKKYTMEGKKIKSEKLLNYYDDLVKNYPIISVEDPFDQDDYANFSEFTKLMKKRKVQVVGDDLLVTNINRVKMAMEKKMCNALLLKVNQVGTVSEAIAAAKFAMRKNWKVMVSHRSGETTSNFISDLAVGLGCGQIKSGAPCRGERMSKYNRLLQIEEGLGKRAKY
jgi:enolase